MSASVTAAAVAVAVGGVAVLTSGLVVRARQRDDELVALIGLPGGTHRDDLGDVAFEHGTILARALGAADRAIGSIDRREAFRSRILRADVALRPSEIVVIAAAAALAIAAALAVSTGTWWTAVLPLVIAPLVARFVLDLLARARGRRFAAELPDALALVASSMGAGHTFLRALQMMAEDRPGPVAIEFRRVINETELGSPLIESLDRLAARMDLRDLDWMVQAIRIQQSVGGPLAELLATLADFMRGREELRREVAVLTAEGRASAWVLGAMPALLLAAVAVVNPGYLDPMLRGWGPWFLGVSTLSVVTGIWFILRMVRSVEV